MTRILIFGDSIVWGADDLKYGGWVDRLKVFLFKKTEHSVYNLGISGNTTKDLLERFEFETKQRLGKGETVFIFSIGVNDSAFICSKKDFWVTSEKFKNNLQKLILLAKKYSSRIIFLNLTPVDELKTMPISWNVDIIYKNEYISKYNEIVKSVCKKNKIYFIEVFEKFTKSDYKKLLEDGLHPNLKGHQKIFEIVKKFLIENKIL